MPSNLDKTLDEIIHDNRASSSRAGGAASSGPGPVRSSSPRRHSPPFWPDKAPDTRWEHDLYDENQPDRSTARVAPPLFEALSTIPLLTQVSCISLDGLFFSYYKDGTHTFAVYSNTTFASNSSIQNPNYTWYTQLVHSEDGALYGD
ncbi:Histidine kinase CKI1-like protein, partial [Drosera capensis]